MNQTIPILLICGPTASGKSALALNLAEQTGAHIVNADSMQVYRDLRIVTARPSEADEMRAPHHLYGHVDAGEDYSVGQWLRETSQVLDRLRAQSVPVIIVGGTGLYFEALTVGLAEIPDIGPNVRQEVRQMWDDNAVDEGRLHRQAMIIDPDAAAKVEPADKQRLFRILEVKLQTGRTLSDWRSTTKPVIPSQAWKGVALTPDRDLLYRQIDERAHIIARDGLGEVSALAARHLDPSFPAMKALGVPQLMGEIEGRLSHDEAVSLVQRDTRRYAKRQLTWVRGRMGDWRKVSTGDLGTIGALIEDWTPSAQR